MPYQLLVMCPATKEIRHIDNFLGLYIYIQLFAAYIADVSITLKQMEFFFTFLVLTFSSA